MRALVGMLALLSLLLAPSPAFSQRSLAPGTRVEIDGVWKGDHVEAVKVVREVPDDMIEIKGHPTRISVWQRTLEIPPFTIEVPPDADIDDRHDEGDSYQLRELRMEWHYQVEGELVGPRRFRAREISVDRKKKKDLVEIEAFVETDRRNSRGQRVITLLGVPCVVTENTEIVAQIFKKPPRRVDYDDERPEDQLILFERVILGGELQVDFDYRDDFDLDKHDNEDRFTIDTSMNFEATVDFGEAGFAFGKMRSAKEYVVSDEDDDLSLHESTALEELYVYWNPLPGKPISLQVGRQDFDDDREWIYDRRLDGVRLHLGDELLSLEYSYSTILHDAERRFRDREQHILFLKKGTTKENYIGAYVVDIRDESVLDDSPFFVGFRAVGAGATVGSEASQPREYMYWLDYAFADGVLGTQKVEAHAFDLGGGFMFPALSLSPYVYAGFAFASGDSRAGGRTSRQFRQTGYQDNNDRFFGVASFRYYGELFRPELSNLHIWTVGTGILPTRNTSLDLVFHHYRQDERAPTLAGAKIRQSPSGTSRDIGHEIDLVFGLNKLFGNMDLEVDVGYFTPGSAFTVNDHPALFTRVQVEWNF